jgi:HD-like signal output (HDOD) protein
MKDTKLKEILTRVKSFPTMPGAGAKMLALLEEPDTAVSEIEEILRYDPGLTANVLKLANSAYFGVPSKIGSLKQAVILLGLKRLMQLVVASCVSAVMDPLPAMNCRRKIYGGIRWQYRLPPRLWRKRKRGAAGRMCLPLRCCTMSASWF